MGLLEPDAEAPPSGSWELGVEGVGCLAEQATARFADPTESSQFPNASQWLDPCRSQLGEEDGDCSL